MFTCDVFTTWLGDGPFGVEMFVEQSSGRLHLTISRIGPDATEEDVVSMSLDADDVRLLATAFRQAADGMAGE